MARLLQLQRYSLVALQSAGADWAWFSAAVFLGAPPLVAQGSARVVGGGVSFVANKLWSFQSSDRAHVPREARRFLVLYAFSYVLSLAIFHVGASNLAVSPWVAKFVADATCFVVNFAVMRTWVFAGAEEPTDP